MQQPDDKDAIALQEAYANIYNEIVKPDRVFVASQYFRQKWVPLLGPALAWVIIALRQHCYWSKDTGHKRDWCLISQDELAAETGLSVATLKRLLKQEYADRFIIDVAYRYRYDREKRKQVRKNSRYRLRMDDPLVPEDEERLKKLLAEKLAGLNIDPETGQLDFRQLLDQLAADLPLNLSDRSTATAPLDQSATELAQRLSHFLTGEAQPNGHQTYPGAVLVAAADLPGFSLPPDHVLVAVNGDFLAVPIAEVVKRDLRQTNGRLTDQRRTECYFSVQDALEDEQREEWQPDEQARLGHMARLERELSEQYLALGGFSLDEALARYFTPHLVAKFLDAAQENPPEMDRLTAWIAYTRQAQGLKNPAGFLRDRLESGEIPPDLSTI